MGKSACLVSILSLLPSKISQHLDRVLMGLGVSETEGAALTIVSCYVELEEREF